MTSEKKSKSMDFKSQKRFSMYHGSHLPLDQKPSEALPKALKRATTLYHGFDMNNKVFSQTLRKAHNSPELQNCLNTPKF